MKKYNMEVFLFFKNSFGKCLKNASEGVKSGYVQRFFNLPTFYIFKCIFQALPEGIFKKEKHFYIVLFHDLLKSGVKIGDFSL